MSDAVSNDDRRAQDYNKLREEYEVNEQKLKKKYNDQLTKAEQEHAHRINQLEEQHAKDLAAYRVNTRESLSDTEQKYQKQISGLQEANRRKSMQDAETAARELQKTEENSDVTVKKNNEIHESQTKTSQKNYENDIRHKDEVYGETADQMRESQRTSLNNERNKLNTANGKEMKNLRDYSEKRIGDLSRDLKTTRDYDQGQVTNLKTKLMQQKQNMDDDKLQTLTDERRRNQNYIDNYREDTSRNMKNLKDKYSEVNRQQDTSFQNQLQSLRDDSQSNYGSEIGGLKRQIRELKNNKDMDNYGNQIKTRDVNQDLMQAHKNELDNAEIEREQILNEADRATSKKVKDIYKDNDNIMETQRRYYQDKITQTQEKYDDSIENQVVTLKTKNETDAVKNEAHSKKLKGLYDGERSQTEDFYKNVIEEKDDLHKQMLKEQRDNLLQDRKVLDEGWKARVRTIEADHVQKGQIRDETYQKQMYDLAEKHHTEMKSLERKYQTRLDELEKSTKFELESQKLQHETREEQMREQQQRQVEQMRQAYASNQINSAKN